MGNQEIAPPANGAPLLTGDEVAERLQVSRSFAFRLMQRGEIATVRLGRLRRVRLVDLEAFIQGNLSGDLSHEE